jgi:acetyl-CoA/propionyl-CoA carboxylase biotin carboxyl carrier protein
MSQDDVTLRGHAIEARINAEHVAAGFVPSPGLITTWRAPSGPGVRVDSGVEAGWEVPATYDSLLAKLITYGADREEARRRMLRALGEFEVAGVPTTIDFHRLAFAHPDFVEGRVSTVSVEREWDLSGIQPAGPVMPASSGADGTVPSRTITVEVGGKRIEVVLFEPRSQPDGRGGGRVAVPRRGRDHVAAPREAPMRTPDLRPPTAERRPAEHERLVVRGGGSETLVAEMQGTIVKTAVQVGDVVAAGDLVLVLEAMKMENHVCARRDGEVTALHVQAGDVVGAGDVLATITSAGPGEAITDAAG